MTRARSKFIWGISLPSLRVFWVRWKINLGEWALKNFPFRSDGNPPKTDGIPVVNPHQKIR